MVFVKNYILPPPDVAEALRHMCVKAATEEHSALLSRAEAELLPRLSPRVCYTELPLSVSGDEVRLGGLNCSSRGLAGRAFGATRAVVFVATVGIEADRLIKRYSSLSPSLALAISALASERVEMLCDLFCRELAEQAEALGREVRPRFSPGYGDLSLEFQREIFRLLSPEGKIGVGLTDGLLMTPTKSVSAIVGICEKSR